MVHALEETRRLLKLDGVLVNMLPVPEGYFIEVHHDGGILFAERKRETSSEDVLRAEAAIKQVLDRGLFLIDQKDELTFEHMAHLCLKSVHIGKSRTLTKKSPRQKIFLHGRNTCTHKLRRSWRSSEKERKSHFARGFALSG